jgi:hypothetical protein
MEEVFHMLGVPMDRPVGDRIGPRGRVGVGNRSHGGRNWWVGLGIVVVGGIDIAAGRGIGIAGRIVAVVGEGRRFDLEEFAGVVVGRIEHGTSALEVERREEQHNAAAL